MDLTLNRMPVEGYVCSLDTVLYQEETQESIVPDASPDILHIISTDAQVGLTRKESMDGKAEAAGVVRVAVLYAPDGEDGARCLSLTVPFRCGANVPGMTPGCSLTVVPRVTGAETRILNPRKVLVRVELAVKLQGWATTEETLCVPWEEPECGIQQKVEDAERYVAVAVVEKSFAYTDEVTLTAGHPAAEALLGHDLDLRCHETKVIGSKLICKGEAVLRVRYRTAEDTLAVNSWELPFSQILELGDVEEEGSCAVDVVEKGSEVTLTTGEEGRTLAVHLELLAQAVVRQTRKLRLFADAYSVTHAVAVERRPCALAWLWEESSAQEAARAVLETPTPAKRIEDCTASIGFPQIEWDGREALLSASGKVTVLYTDESDALCSVTAPITAQCRIGLPENGRCSAGCDLAGEPQAVIVGTGIEVRCPVQFRYWTVQEKEKSVVDAISAQERETAEDLPSVILRMAQPDESLWDIAKAYCTTQDAILAANELPDPDHLGGSLLLIPRSRT